MFDIVPDWLKSLLPVSRETHGKLEAENQALNLKNQALGVKITELGAARSPVAEKQRASCFQWVSLLIVVLGMGLFATLAKLGGAPVHTSNNAAAPAASFDALTATSSIEHKQCNMGLIVRAVTATAAEKEAEEKYSGSAPDSKETAAIAHAWAAIALAWADAIAAAPAASATMATADTYATEDNPLEFGEPIADDTDAAFVAAFCVITVAFVAMELVCFVYVKIVIRTPGGMVNGANDNGNAGAGGDNDNANAGAGGDNLGQNLNPSPPRILPPLRRAVTVIRTPGGMVNGANDNDNPGAGGDNLGQNTSPAPPRILSPLRRTVTSPAVLRDRTNAPPTDTNPRSAKLRGVFKTRSNRWRIQVWYGDSSRSMGTFNTEEVAAAMYDRVITWFKLHQVARKFDSATALNNKEENYAGDVNRLMETARDSRPMKERLTALKHELETW